MDFKYSSNMGITFPALYEHLLKKDYFNYLCLNYHINIAVQPNDYGMPHVTVQVPGLGPKQLEDLESDLGFAAYQAERESTLNKIMGSLQSADNLPAYIQYYEDTLIKYLKRGQDVFAVIFFGDTELVHFVHYNGHVDYNKSKVEEDGQVWLKALAIIDNLTVNFDEVEDKVKYFDSLVKEV